MARDAVKQREYMERWRSENPVTFTTARLRERIKRYGLSVEQFALLALQQDFACAICRRRPDGEKRHQRRLHVDHDHESGQVRGILCMNCNLALGAAQDDPEILRRMASYLEQTQ